MATPRTSVDSIRERVPSSWRSDDMPESLRHSEGFFRNRRGQSLSYLSLFPEEGTTLRGVVVFLHGIVSHSRRFFHVYEQLCEHGFAAVAYDLLSHGQSDSCEHKRRGHARKFHYFVDDTNDFVTFAKKEIVPKMLSEGEQAAGRSLPLILAGYSFGALVGIHTLLTKAHEFSAVVLLSPLISIQWTPILRIQSFFAMPLSALVPRAHIVPATKYEHLCRDPAFLEDIFSDPLTVPKKYMTVRMGEQIVKAFAALEDEKQILDPKSAFCSLPVLLLLGSADKMASLPLAKEFFSKIKNADKELKVFQGLYHALFDDPEKDEVFDHLLNWLQTRFPEPSEGSESCDRGAEQYAVLL